MTPTLVYIMLGLLAALGIALGFYFHEKAKNLTLTRALGVQAGLAKLKDLERMTNEQKEAFDHAIAAYIAKYGDPSKR